MKEKPINDLMDFIKKCDRDFNDIYSKKGKKEYKKLLSKREEVKSEYRTSKNKC